MYTFLANFLGYMDRQGIPYTQDIDGDYDILFVNSWAVPYSNIKRLKRSRPQLRVVQRVDGSGRDYGRFDDADDRQARVNMLADLTVFQSRYCRFSASQKYKVIQQDGPVIYNPVDLEVFTPEGPTKAVEGEIKVCVASFSTNRMKGTWKVESLARSNPDITFVLCGRFPQLPDLANIKMVGYLGRDEIAATMRSCDVFLHLAENDPCPNVVIEALASGLPVIYRDSGGTPELVGEGGLSATDDTFREALVHVIDRREELSNAARSRAVEHFSPDRIFPKYLTAIAEAKRRPLPSPVDFVRARMRGYPVAPRPTALLRRLSPRHIAGKFVAKLR